MLPALLVVLVVFALVGVLMYLIETQIPMPSGYKTALRVIVLVVLVIWALYKTGVLGFLERA